MGDTGCQVLRRSCHVCQPLRRRHQRRHHPSWQVSVRRDGGCRAQERVSARTRVWLRSSSCMPSARCAAESRSLIISQTPSGTVGQPVFPDALLLIALATPPAKQSAHSAHCGESADCKSDGGRLLTFRANRSTKLAGRRCRSASG